MLRQRVVDRGWNNIRYALKNGSTKVGFPYEGSPTQGEASNMSEIATIASFQEFGTKQIVTPRQSAYLRSQGFPVKIGSEIVNPTRSFIRTAFDESLNEIKSLRDKLYKNIIGGKIGVLEALKILGEFLTNKTKKKVHDITEPPLHWFTIDRKSSSKPLIDKGQMINSIQHKEHLK